MTLTIWSVTEAHVSSWGACLKYTSYIEKYGLNASHLSYLRHGEHETRGFCGKPHQNASKNTGNYTPFMLKKRREIK